MPISICLSKSVSIQKYQPEPFSLNSTHIGEPLACTGIHEPLKALTKTLAGEKKGPQSNRCVLRSSQPSVGGSAFGIGTLSCVAWLLCVFLFLCCFLCLLLFVVLLVLFEKETQKKPPRFQQRTSETNAERERAKRLEGAEDGEGHGAGHFQQPGIGDVQADLSKDMAVVRSKPLNGIPFWLVNSPPMLEPILVGKFGCSLGVRDFDPWQRLGRFLLSALQVNNF